MSGDIDETTAVVAHIEDQFVGTGGFQRGKRVVQCADRRLDEVTEEDVADAAAVNFKNLRQRHRWNGDDALGHRRGLALSRRLVEHDRFLLSNDVGTEGCAQ